MAEGAEKKNKKLKRMLADAILNNPALKDLLGKSVDAGAQRGSGVFAVGAPDE